MEQMSERRAELLDSIVDAMLEMGVAEISLRPLAEQVGTSARLLIYHFDTKENLIACALAQVRERVEASLKALSARSGERTLSAVLQRFWGWATEAENQKYFRLLFEVDGLSMFNRLRFSEESRFDSISVWLDMIADVDVSPEGVKPPISRTTFIVGATTGILQDFLSTGDRARTTAAFHYLIEQTTGEVIDPALPSAVSRKR